MTSPVYFYGIQDRNRLGHSLWTPDLHRIDPLRWPGDFPWQVQDLDGGMQPTGDYQLLGVARLHHKADWTAVSFWDRSGDARFNSNGSFVAKGTHNFAEMMALAVEHFSVIVDRVGPLVETQP